MVQALNKVLAHVGHPGARKFTKGVIGKINGFKGRYSGAPPSSHHPSPDTRPEIAQPFLRVQGLKAAPGITPRQIMIVPM